MMKILTSERRRAARHSSPRRQTEALYLALIRRVREPVFYRGFQVADSREGHFDLMMAHLWVVLERMRAAEAAVLAQLLVDRVFLGFEEDLREAGAGDSQALRALKGFAGAFAGRLEAYGAAKDDAALKAALLRNLWPGAGAEEIRTACAAMTHYLQDLRTRLTDWLPMQESLDFGPLPG